MHPTHSLVFCVLLIWARGCAQEADKSTQKSCGAHTTCSECVLGDCVWNECSTACEVLPVLSACAQWTVGYNLSHACDCSPNLFLANMGAFDDGSNAANYENGLNCRYFISPAQNRNITFVEFQSFDLERGSRIYDSVRVGTSNASLSQFVYDTSLEPLTVGFYGNSLQVPQRVCAVGDGLKVLIDFVTDASVTNAGWSLVYGSYNFGESLCCGAWELTTATGNFSDGSSSWESTSGMVCTFLINPVSANGETVAFDLHFSRVNLVSGDGIVLWGLNSANRWDVVGTISANGEKRYCIPSMKQLRVEYNTTTAYALRGFQASYSTLTSSNACANICPPLTTMTTPTGNFADSSKTFTTGVATIVAQRNCQLRLMINPAVYASILISFTKILLGPGSSITVQDIDYSTGQVISTKVIRTSGSYPTCLSSPYALISFDAAGDQAAGFKATYYAQRDQIWATAVLESIFIGLGGPNWEIQTRWRSDSPKCFWYGVRCTCGQLSALELSSNSLTTTNLSAVFAGVETTNAADTVQTLDFSSNAISGTIATEFGSLYSLQVLNLNSNSLVGTIPSELTSLSNLKQLQLQNNMLSGTIPSGWSNKLEVFDLSNNMFHGSLPSSLAVSGVVAAASCNRNYIYPDRTARVIVICSPFRAPMCGDGILSRDASCAAHENCCGEQCDDGNLVDGDGCSSNCQIEAGFFCAGQPSECGQVECVVTADSPTIQNSDQITQLRDMSCGGIPATITIADVSLAITSDLCSLVRFADQNVSEVVFNSSITVSHSISIQANTTAMSFRSTSSDFLFQVATGSNLTLDRVVLVGCGTGGGVILNSGSQLSAVNSSFSNFSTAVKLASNSAAQITQCVFSNNNQAAIASNGSLHISNSTLTNNTPEHIWTNSTTVVDDSIFECVQGTPHISQGPHSQVDLSDRTNTTSCSVFVTGTNALRTQGYGTAQDPLRGFWQISSVIANGLEIVIDSEGVVDLSSNVTVQNKRNVLFRAENNTVLHVHDSQFNVVKSSNVRFSQLRIANSSTSNELLSSVISTKSSSIIVEDCEFTHLNSITPIVSTQSQLVVRSSKFMNLKSSDNNAVLVVNMGNTPSINALEIQIRDSLFVECDSNQGAVYSTDKNARIVLENCVFSQLTSLSKGGAINFELGAVDVVNSTFSHNQAQEGGAISATGGTLVVREGTTFVANSATQRGGSISALGGSVVVADVAFDSNTCDSLECSGGAIHSEYGLLSVTRTNFTLNTAFAGAAIRLDGSLLSTEKCNTTIIESYFQSNTGQISGALHVLKSIRVNISRSFFHNNRVVGLGSGGALFLGDTSDVFVESSVFTNNSCSQKGGVVMATNLVTSYFSRCWFQKNTADVGGAIYGDSSADISVYNCSVVSNTARVGGGGLFLDGLAALLVLQTSFLNNSAPSGGALQIASRILAVVDNSKFAFNLATQGDGGALLVFFANLQLVQSSFEYNSAANSGGAMFASVSTINLQLVDLNHNTASSGGAIFTTRGSFFASQSNFSHNNAQEFAGAAFGLACQFNCVDCIFSSNSASQAGAIAFFGNSIPSQLVRGTLQLNEAAFGGAIFLVSSEMGMLDTTLSANSAFAVGGAIYSSTSNVRCTGCIGVDNHAPDGGFAYMQKSTTKFENCVLTDNRAAQYGGALHAALPQQVTLSNCILENNMAYNGGGIYALLDSTIRKLSFEEVICTENKAEKAGGCLFVVAATIWSGFLAPTNIFIKNSNIEKNIAGRNGGGAVFSNIQGVVVQGSWFDKNLIQRAGAENDLPQNQIGGGALWLSYVPTLSIESSMFKSNAVVGEGNGGGVLFVQPESTQVEIANTTFQENSAQLGGGGAVFWAGPTSPPKIFFSTDDSHPNSALYGPSTASTACFLVVNQGTGTEMQAYVGRGQAFPSIVQVALHDSFGNIVRNENSTFVQAVISGSEFGLVGADIVQFQNGVADFTQLGVLGTAGETTQLSFLVLGTNVDSHNASVPVVLSFELERLSLGIVIALGGTALFICSLLLMFVQLNRSNPFIRKISPNFCISTLVGAAIISATIFYFQNLNSNLRCDAIVWQLSLGSALLMGSLFMKKYRIFKIFVNPHLTTISNVQDKHLFAWLSMCLCFDLVCLSLHSALGSTKTKLLTSNSGYGHHTCKIEISAPLIVLIVFKGLKLIAGCVLTFLTRNVESEYNESRTIGFCLYNIFVCVFVASVCLQTMGGKYEFWSALEICLLVAIVCSSTFSVCLLFFRQLETVLLPKIKRLHSTATSKTKITDNDSISSAALATAKPVAYVYRHGRKEAINLTNSSQL